jgi:S-adenosylmethionine:tRNA ribosyltransferase-isomerase
MIKLTDFDYQLPKELIAQRPLKERESARLMVLDCARQTIRHQTFRDIADILRKGDLLVLNDTKVLPCRLIGRRSSGAKVDILLLRQRQGLSFNCLAKPSRLKPGEKLSFNGNGLSAELISKNEIKFLCQDKQEIYAAGKMPLPPYIKRLPEETDKETYQTVYARNQGAVAAPTAGLHFSQELISKIKSNGVKITYLTLHVGPGTFRPLKDDSLNARRLPEEEMHIPDAAIRLIREARQEGRRIFACGTTSCRALESYAASGHSADQTDLFIYPGYVFRLTDGLITNFHLPRTSLLMLVYAFGGEALVRRAYQEAIQQGYRFYSYGDAMLILR